MNSSLCLRRVLVGFLSTALLTIGISLLHPQTSRAEMIWDWSFDTEAGTFTTDGDLVGGFALPGTYNVLNFAVTTSAGSGAEGNLLGGDFTMGTVAPEGFVWDGMAPTQFFRTGGTNGSFFYSVPSGFYWNFVIPEFNSNVRDTNKGITVASGIVSLVPPIPEPSTFALMGIGIAAIGWTRRSALRNLAKRRALRS